MRAFRRNVLRLALRSRASAMGSMIIIAIGVFVMVAMFDTLQNLTGQIYSYYEDHGMADVFAEVRGMPSENLGQLEEIEGISGAGGRLSAEVRMVCEGQEEIASVHLMAFDPSQKINRIDLQGKTMDEEGLFIGSRMAKAYGLEPGDGVSLIIGGSSLDFKYRGVLGAPDYIYAVSSIGAMIPDGLTYDIACMDRFRMSSLLGMQGQLTELGFKLGPGYTFEDVRSSLSAALEPYGLLSMTDKASQMSYSIVEGEVDELIALGTVLPALFLAISVFMLCTALKKMVDRDQTVIGSMKAFGLSDAELIGAYMVQGLSIGVLGALAGWLLAVPFGSYMFDIYLDFFSLPQTVYRNYWNSRIAGLALSASACAAAVLLGVRRILAITPATAMKPASPASARQGSVPSFLIGRLGTFRKLGLRSMTRSPLRGLIMVLAVTFPFAMCCVLFSFIPTIDRMLDRQFGDVQRYDLMVCVEGFSDPHELSGAGYSLGGIERSEGICRTPVRLRSENLKSFAVLVGAGGDSNLLSIMDVEGEFFRPPGSGIILSDSTAEELHVFPGDSVEVQLPALGTAWIRLPVCRVVSELFGGNCYMDLGSFTRQIGIRPVANTLLLDVRSGGMDEVKESLRQSAGVLSITDSAKIVGSFEDMMGSMIFMIDMFGLFSVTAGFVLIYNISAINIRERFTELGTLEVMGASEKEIAVMLGGEKAVYLASGLLLGIPAAAGLKSLMERIIISESYNIKIYISAGSVAVTLIMCAAMMLAAWYREVMLLRKIALTDILKERG